MERAHRDSCTRLLSGSVVSRWNLSDVETRWEDCHRRISTRAIFSRRVDARPTCCHSLTGDSSDLQPDLKLSIQLVLPLSKEAKKSGTQTPQSRADLFSRALSQLQSSLDPALSSFEDESLKLSSHQRILSFVERQKEELKHRVGVARLQMGEAQHALQRLSDDKAQLAARIQRLERDIECEKRAQADAAEEEAAADRVRNAQRNLRRNFEGLIAKNLPAEDEQQPDPTALLAEQISKVKQQKKLLIKSARALAAEGDAISAERAEYEAKIQEIRSKLAAVGL